MKITAIFITAACLTAAASGHSQRVTLSLKEAPLKTVFMELNRQTGYNFLYSDEMLATAKKVTIDVKDASLDEVLALSFKNQPLQFSITENTIVVKAKLSQASPGIASDEGAKQSPLPIPPIDIKGRILSDDGEPLVGATVKVKGSNTATKTDADGRFTLTGVDENATLEISYVGFETSTIKVDGKTNIAISLKRSDSPLDVVMIKAYGTTTRRLDVGNISSVKAADIAKQPVSNPLLALQGRVPGLFITQSSGLSGSGVTVRLQGQNSIGNGNDPLYVIDGIPYVSQLLPTINTILGSSGGVGSTGSGNPLSFINPSDIESIDILKDADATAIYGSRAANGAILITTKKGKAGQTKVDITMQSGWGNVTRKLDIMNTPQYLQMRREGFKNDNAFPDPLFDPDVNGVWDSTRSTDWQKQLIGGTANYTDVQANISGGNANTQYLIGGGYHKETTVFPGDLSDKKGSFHFSINNTSANQKFHVQLSGNYLVDNNILQFSDLTNAAISLPPDAPSLYNADGTLNWAQVGTGSAATSTWTNPLSFLYIKYKNKTNNLIGNAILNYKIVPGLEIKTSLGYTNLQSNEVQGVPKIAQAPEARPTYNSIANYANSTINTWLIEPQLTYKRTIGNGKLDVLLGTTFHQNNSSRQQLTGRTYNSDAVLEDIKSAATVTVSSTLNNVYKYNALFGRVSYNLQDKYIINLSARRDGSSRFGSENLFHNFGSVGGAWIFSKENFIANNLSFLSFGKFKGSYGTTGNDQIGDYQFMSLFIPYSVTVPYQGISSINPNGLPNPNFHWEETKKLQFGLDLGFLSDRILFSMSYFRNQSSNQLLFYNLPIITGFSNIPTINFPATVRNTGLEFMINTTNIKTKSFEWSSSFNLTSPKNKLVAFPNISTSTYANTYIIGQPITSVRVYHFLGVDPATGLYTVADINGNPTTNPNTITDKTVLINTAPKYYGGFQNSFTYKKLQLDFLFQFVKQVGPNYLFGNIPGQFSNQPLTVTSHWQKPGDISTIQRYTSGSIVTAVKTSSNATNSDARYSDASYVRLKNLSLSWQLPEKLMKKSHLQNSRVFVQGQNLFTITNYQGLDPENRSTLSLPPLRVITMGVQVVL